MRLKELMEERNVKQLDISAALGVGRSSISQYANGQREPDINTLKKLADYFGVTVDYLINHDTKNSKEPPAPRNFINVGGKKYDLNETPVKLEINGVVVDLSINK